MTIDNWRARYDHLNAETDRLRAEVERLREDADKLRVLLAASNANCAFCGLPAAEMAKCASGFPGCSRADDMILCVHPTRQDLLDEVERMREDAARAQKLYDDRQDDWIAERENLQTLNMQLVKNHDAMQAERDAAQKRVQDCETRMMRYAIELAEMQAERDAARAASEKDREWVGRALEKQAEYLGQSQMLVAERDAARAEVERLREDAARARWCEEKKASVFWSILALEWRVAVYDEAYNSLYTSKADRNAAIDAARGRV